MDTHRVSQTPLPDWLDDDLSQVLRNLRCTRRGDRDRMVKEFTRLAEHYGATITANPSPLNERHGISVHIRRGTAYVAIFLDGTSRNHMGTYNRTYGGVYLGHWNIEARSPTRYSAYFGTLIGGSINQFHRQKATMAVEGFGYFCVRLGIALGALQDGTAFEVADEAAV